jgi:hypothetical protein
MPNKHKLGAYLAPHHDPEAWHQYLFEIDPPWVRILLPGDAPVELVSQAFHLCPEAEISLRWWDLDDGGEPNKRSKFTDPLASATKDVAEMVHRIQTMENEAARHGLPFPSRSQLWINTPNEPPTWEHALRPRIVENAAEMVRLAAMAGLGTMALELAVGHPEEWPPTWSWAQRVLDAIVKYDGVLALHEYWQPEGPFYAWGENQTRKDWGALAGRYQHFKGDVPIVISETGVDGRIYNRHATPDTGYLKFMNADQYAAQMRSYLEEVHHDKRILAVLPFITDVQDGEWESFNTLYAKSAFDVMLTEMDNAQPSDKPAHPVVVRLPDVRADGGDSEPASEPVAPVVYPVTHYAAIDPFVAKAVLMVESGGQGLNPDGTLKLRFEAHIFEKYVAKNIFDAHFRYDRNDILQAWYRPNIHSAWVSYHNTQSNEHTAFNLARTINNRAAHLSISMGAAQIMGFNHARAGFATPEQMYEAFTQDTLFHLIGFFNYCFTSKPMMDALLAKDWRAMALHYNGAGLVDLYSVRLEQAYTKLKGDSNGQQ